MCFFIIWSSFSVVQDRNPKNPHNGLVTSPDPFFLLPRCCPATELSTTTKFNTTQPRRIKPRKAQRRRRTHTCAHQCWTKKSNSGTSDVESSSELLSPDTFESNKRLIVVIGFFSSIFFCLQVPPCLKRDTLAPAENQSLLSVQALPALHGLAMALAPKCDAPPRRPITGERDPAAAVRTQLGVSILRLMNGPSNIILLRFDLSALVKNPNQIFISHHIPLCILLQSGLLLIVVAF